MAAIPLRFSTSARARLCAPLLTILALPGLPGCEVDSPGEGTFGESEQRSLLIPLTTSMTLGTGQSLGRRSGDINLLVSPNGQLKLSLDTGTGQLTLRYLDVVELWSSPVPEPFDEDLPTWAVLGQDGNFVVYNGDDEAAVSIWATNTAESQADSLALQDDGNLVLYAGEVLVWSSGTAWLGGVPMAGSTFEGEDNTTLEPGAFIENGASRLHMLPNGKLVLSSCVEHCGTDDEIRLVTWQPDLGNNSPVPGSRFVFQQDGDLVIYTGENPAQVVWAAGNKDPNVDRFELLATGDLVAFAGADRSWSSGTACFGPLAINDDPASEGRWEPVVGWPVIPIHTLVLPSGEVLSFGTNEVGEQGAMAGQHSLYDVWDPSGGLGPSSHTTYASTFVADMFCSAPLLDPLTGEVVIAGGDTRGDGQEEGFGVNAAMVFNPDDASLMATGDMNYPRWYPTMTALPSGELLVHGGRGTKTGGTAAQPVFNIPGPPEVYANGQWIEVVDKDQKSWDAITPNDGWYYPRNFIAPDGRVFGISRSKMYLMDVSDPSSEKAGRLSVADFPGDSSGYTSTAVMYRPGKILQLGGPATNDIGEGPAIDAATIIDITGIMSGCAMPGCDVTVTNMDPGPGLARAWAGVTLLASGDLLVTGGSATTNELPSAPIAAELWEVQPDDSFVQQVLPPGKVPRLYHSTAVLLPDATVLVGGGGSPGPLLNTNAEIYEPPYLFGQDQQRVADEARPQLTLSGTQFIPGAAMVASSDRPIARLTAVRMGASTHSMNMDQHFLELDIETTPNSNQASTSWPHAHETLPGHYMVFAFDDQGVPSLAKVVALTPGALTLESEIIVALTGTYPQAVEMSEGELLVGYEQLVDQELTLRTAQSDDGGLTWTELGTVAQAPNDPGTTLANPMLLAQPNQGALMAYRHHDQVGPDYVHRLLVSGTYDGGATWDFRGEIEVNTDAHAVWEPLLFQPTNGPLQAYYTRAHELDGATDIVMRSSNDGGGTWTELSVVASDGDSRDGMPGVAVMDDGTQFAVFQSSRDQQPGSPLVIRAVQSTDGGVTWDNRQDVYVPADASAHAAAPSVTKLDDGRLLVAFMTDEDADDRDWPAHASVKLMVSDGVPTQQSVAWREAEIVVATGAGALWPGVVGLSDGDFLVSYEHDGVKLRRGRVSAD